MFFLGGPEVTGTEIDQNLRFSTKTQYTLPINRHDRLAQTVPET